MRRIALVTGGAGGIGAAACRELAKASHRVAVADIDAPGAEQVAAGLPGNGHGAFAVDVTDEAAVVNLFDAVERALGPVAVLACIAGGNLNTHSHQPPVADTSLEDWAVTEALNARSTFLCVREYLRRRRETPVEHGRIIAMSSLSAEQPGGPTGAAYAAAKAAILGFTRYVAHEVGPFGITANAICPGAVDTSGFRATVSEERAAGFVPLTPMRRIGQPEDVAAMVAFLASPAASFVTGCAIDVNGGRYMR